MFHQWLKFEPVSDAMNRLDPSGQISADEDEEGRDMYSPQRRRGAEKDEELFAKLCVLGVSVLKNPPLSNLRSSEKSADTSVFNLCFISG